MKKLWFKYKEYILYIIFGGLTTVVNYVVYLALTRPLGLKSVLIANAISWIAAVAFAYLTNRIWVFESKSAGVGPVLKEAGKFVAGRLITLGIESLIIWIFVDLIGCNDIVIKLIASIVTIILNYIFSKFLIFTGSRKK
ncbi:MAG: GtrA family protein [Parasporobacterium sp.]|nr:GtrA family protein [Parasporobacterium sp.]